MILKSVITTIAEPTEAMKTLSRYLQDVNASLITVGDTKGPKSFNLPNAEFLPIEKQMGLPFKLAKALPTKHYARKNIGYLQAISEKADVIYETDDDNAPLTNWKPRSKTINDVRIVRENGWTNVYKYFTSQNIWPRGLLLDEIHTVRPVAEIKSQLEAPIQQGLVNLSPDVDAIWRLAEDRPFDFDNEQSVCLGPHVWCPFNTQSTWWFPKAYPLMYVPSNCSFRMCDIWKSFIAQRCLWEIGHGVVFHAPEVIQERNVHNLMKDFTDEIPGYTGNKKLTEVLENTKLLSGENNIQDNLMRCYEALQAAGFFPLEELQLVKLWLSDIAKYL
ncbi:MAG: DUF288 domain-containing protein [Victivallales bacterium]|nr:DUF288 domain-containing protein [Victivallales bacterium]